jgi:predicted MFS family arabinose efflux permease
MMILEGIFAVNFFDRRRSLRRDDMDIADLVPIRLMVFLAYGTDCMQDAFIAILCSRLYAAAAGSGGLFLLPEGLVIALPMSLQLLLAAAASVFGGRLAEKYGAVKVMGAGFLFQISGFLLCAAAGNQYYGILGGKLFIGLGLGLIYVAANTMAAMSEGEKSSKAFADVSAGVLSGVTIGVGLGSILLSMGSYRLVYASGAALLALGLGVLLFFGKGADRGKVSAGPEVSRTEEGEKTGISTLRFLLDRQVASFFLLILTPFMMALSYREYFFPLFVTDYGISEVQIGQIYLLCGIATLYPGPFLAKMLLKRLGAKGSIIFASGLMAANMVIFVVWPSLASVLAGVGILSIVISFAYTCQYTYFENVPMAKRYGEGASMGIYSMFESLGQTLGPILYGIALGFGRRKGIFVIAALMEAMILGFIILNLKRNIYKEGEGQ